MIDRSALLRSVYEGALTHLRARLDDDIPARLTELLEGIGPGGRVLLVAFGKASRPMATRALETLAAMQVEVDGLLVPANDDGAALPPLEVIPGGHPLPTAGSFAAGRRALRLVSSAGPTRSSSASRSPALRGRKPTKVKRSAPIPETVSAASTAEGPGTAVTA